MLQGLRFLLVLYFFQYLLARDHNVAALLVQLDDGDFEQLSLDRVQVAYRAQIRLGARKECPHTHDFYRQAALDTLDHHRLNGPLFLVGLLNFVPGTQSLCFLVGKPDVAFLGFALVAHHVDLIPGLESGVAFVIQHFGQRQHALGFGADVHHDVGGGKLQHGTFERLIVARSFFALRGEGRQSSSEVIGGCALFFVLAIVRLGRLRVSGG